MSSPRQAAGDGASSGWHEVLVISDPAGRWQILDAAGSQFVVVETLTGHDDRLDQALALACDYAAEQQAYHEGRRESDPFPSAYRLGKGLDATA